MQGAISFACAIYRIDVLGLELDPFLIVARPQNDC
jgi:hypothetical protein